MLTNPIVNDRLPHKLEIDLKNMNIIPGKAANKNSGNVLAKIVFSVLAVSFLASSLIKPVKAQYYNGSDDEVSEIIVDKTIRGLSEGEWKDNYSSDEMVFGPETLFDYKVLIKNEGNRNQTWVNVIDTLPPYLDLVFGYNPDDDDTFNTQNRELTWKISEIRPGEEESRVIRVKVKSENDIPEAITKITNNVCAKAESGAEDCDNAIAYIGNGKLKTTELPATGNPIVIGSLVGVGILGLAIILRKYGRGQI